MSSAAKGTVVPVRSPSASFAEIDGSVVLYDPDRDEVTRLDQVASVVWSCIDDRATIDELVADLAEGFAADPELVRADVVDLTTRLREAGLIIDPAGSASPAVPVASTPDAAPRVLTDPPSP